MKSWGYKVEEGRPSEVGLEAAEASFRTCGFVWLHLDGRSQECLDWLRGQRDIPDHVVNALVAVETRPRAEVFGEGVLLNLRGLGETPEDDEDHLVSIRLWAESGRVISVSFRTLAVSGELRDAMSDGRIQDPGDLIVTLADLLTARLDPVVAELGDRLDQHECDFDVEKAFELRRSIRAARSSAIEYRRFVAPQRSALERLATLTLGWLHDDDRMHLRESADRVSRMIEELESIRERSALLHEMFTDLRAEQMNQRALMLSEVALIFLPLTFVTGLLGMNVAGIPDKDSPYAFWTVALMCLGIGVALWTWFRRKGWF